MVAVTVPTAFSTVVALPDIELVGSARLPGLG